MARDLTDSLVTTAAYFGGGASGPATPGGMDPALMALLAAEQGGGSSSAAAEVAAEMSGGVSFLPPWARDLDIVGILNPESPTPLVWMKDGQKATTQIDVNSGDFGDDIWRSGGASVTEGSEDFTKAQTVDRALNQPYTWSDEEIEEAKAKMAEAGFEVSSFGEVLELWNAAVGLASDFYMGSKGERKMTPWDALDFMARENESSGMGEGPFTGTKTQVSRNITEVDEGEAWSTMRSAVSNLLGRDPSDREVRDFTYRMNQVAARNPSISKTTAKYEEGDLVSSTTRTTPGFTGDDMVREAYDDAQADPNYAEYTAATTYFNAALGALGAIGGA